MYPEIKAAMKPMIRELTGVAPPAPISPPTNSRRFAPIIGINTMRNENLAKESLSLPISNPVHIVAPEREIPGIVAKA